jgi:O-antigen ligase
MALSDIRIKMAAWLGGAGIWLYAFSAFLSTAGASLGFVLFTLAMPMSDVRWRRWIREPLIIISVGFSIFILLQTYFAIQWLPAAKDEILDKLVGWLKLLLFIPFGFWMARWASRRLTLLFVSVIGLAIGMLASVDWSTPAQFLQTRTGFQFPAIGFAYVAGIAILGLFMLGLDALKGMARKRQVVTSILLLLLLLMLIQGFIQSYSRGAWLAMAVALPVLFAAWYRHRASVKTRLPRRSQLAVGVLLLAVAGLVIYMNNENIAQRVVFESEVISSALSDQRDETEFSSTGLRLNVWRFGLEKFAERPIFGWGAGSAKYLIEQSGAADRLASPDGKWLPHLHNSYLEVLVQFGLVGFVWVLTILVLLGRMMLKVTAAGIMPRPYSLFFLFVVVFAAIWCVFDYRIVHRDWQFSWIILAGTIFSFHLQSILPGGGDTEARDRAE